MAACIDAHAKAARDTAPDKTDANDADGLTGKFARILPGVKQVCSPAGL
jgi:hypothetical protein